MFKIGDLFNPNSMFYGIMVPNCMCKLSSISWSAKAVYGRLTQYSGRDGRVYPKQKTLSYELGLSKITIIRSLKELEDNKFITIVKPTGSDKLKHFSNSYGFLWHECFDRETSVRYQKDTSEGIQNDTSNNENNNQDSFSSKTDNTAYCPISEKEGVSEETHPLSIKNKNIIIKRRVLTPVDIKTLLPEELHPHTNVVKKPIKSIYISEDIQDILDFWVEEKLHLPKKETKGYNDGVKKIKGLLNGKLFGKKYTIDEIKKSILNFSFAALDSDFEPSDLSSKKILAKKNISEFIYNPFVKNSSYSLFQDFLDTPPKVVKFKNIITTEYPGIVKQLKKFYRESVVGNANIEFSNKDENCFAIAANKIMVFREKNINRFNKYMRVNPNSLAIWLCEAIQADCNDDVSKITPGWFASDVTFNRRFPAYLFRNAILEDSKNNKYQELIERENEIIEY